MILEIQSFQPYADFINEISADSNYSDPHFLYNENNLYDALEKKNQRAFVSMNEKTVTGLFVWLIIPEDNYVEMIIGFTKNGDAFSDMLAYIEKQYSGCRIDFVVNPYNQVICNKLKERGAIFEKEQQKMVQVKEVQLNITLHIELYSPDWQEHYCALHRKDTYWTAERVLAASDRFRVFIARIGEEIVGYLDITYCFEENEPYDLYVKREFAHRGYELALLVKAIEYNKPHKMMALIDIDASEEIEVYTAAGFERIEGNNCVFASYKAKK